MTKPEGILALVAVLTISWFTIAAPVASVGPVSTARAQRPVDGEYELGCTVSVEVAAAIVEGLFKRWNPDELVMAIGGVADLGS